MDYIIVHGALYSPGDYRQLIEAMDQRADLRLDSQTRWEARETRAYRVIK